MEITSLEDKIKLYADSFVTPELANTSIKIEVPFYIDGLFIDCRKELFGFNNDLSKSLFEFYTYLLKAERDRKINKEDMFFSKQMTK